MKLYNKTRCPDELLERILYRAGKLAGARTSNTIVMVNSARSKGHCRGLATHCTARKIGGRWVKTEGGYFKITLPIYDDSLLGAETFFSVALHEWVHIADFQAMDNGENRSWDRNYGREKRRAKHDHRPEEIRANCVQRENESKYIDDDILDLALWTDANKRS